MYLALHLKTQYNLICSKFFTVLLITWACSNSKVGHTPKSWSSWPECNFSSQWSISDISGIENSSFLQTFVNCDINGLFIRLRQGWDLCFLGEGRLCLTQNFWHGPLPTVVLIRSTVCKVQPIAEMLSNDTAVFDESNAIKRL